MAFNTITYEAPLQITYDIASLLKVSGIRWLCNFFEWQNYIWVIGA